MASETGKNPQAGLTSNERSVLMSLISGYVARSGDSGLTSMKMTQLIQKAKQLAAMLGLLLIMTLPANAQTKPLGVWDLGASCVGVKSWMQFSTLAVWEDFNKAAECSRTTGMKWILQFGFDAPLGTSVDSELQFTKDKLAQSRLLASDIVGMTYVEEWYGLTNKRTIQERQQVWAFGSEQHRKLKEAFPGWLMIYVDQLVNSDPQYGVDLYMPLPQHTDVFAFEMYDSKEKGHRELMDLYFNYVKNTTTVPILLIGQGFYDKRYPMYSKPSESYVEWWRGYVKDPRVMASVIFTWRDRAPGTIVGLSSMPQVEAWFIR